MARREQLSVGQLTITDKIIFAKQGASELNDAIIPVSLLALGAPTLEVADRFVTEVHLKVGDFTVAHTTHSDGLARSVRITLVQKTAADTFAKIKITGTDYLGNTITEEILPVDNTTADGLKCFLTVTAVEGLTGWVGADPDHVTVGSGPLVQIPVFLSAASQILMAIFNTAIINAPTVTVSATDISLNTINASALTYDGTKKLSLLINP